MPTTFTALAVVVIALLPGALYVWATERVSGAWGARATDRVLRFIGASAVIQALIAPWTYSFWVHQWPKLQVGGAKASWWLWAEVLLYVALPIGLGTAVGYGIKHRKKWTLFIAGPDPAPRAWDHLFALDKPDGWIRLRLNSGSWLGGAYSANEYGLESYSSGYPEAEDLFLAAAVAVDPVTGDFELDEDGAVRPTGSGILVRWSRSSTLSTSLHERRRYEQLEWPDWPQRHRCHSEEGRRLLVVKEQRQFAEATSSRARTRRRTPIARDAAADWTVTSRRWTQAMRRRWLVARSISCSRG